MAEIINYTVVAPGLVSTCILNISKKVLVKLLKALTVEETPQPGRPKFIAKLNIRAFYQERELLYFPRVNIKTFLRELQFNTTSK